MGAGPRICVPDVVKSRVRVDEIHLIGSGPAWAGWGRGGRHRPQAWEECLLLSQSLERG